MSIRHRQNRLDRLDAISENVRDALELAREEDSPRDIEIRFHLALAVQDIDNLRGEHYEDYI
mgnify:CR=1 FL=1